MKIEQIINKLILLQALGHKEVVINDCEQGVVEDFKISLESVYGREVIEPLYFRSLQHEPLNKEDYKEVYYKSTSGFGYSNFDDFYAFCEGIRIKEIERCENSRKTVVISVL